jgi:RNA polymerase sigma-70 factor (ECF subfamily)
MATPDQNIQWREWRSSLWSAVASLPEAQRYAIVLRYAEGMNYAEIAKVLDCPVGTVRSRLHYGLMALQEKLGDAANPPTLQLANNDMFQE